MSVLRDFSARYTPSESWLYDRLIAPAVLELGEELAVELLGLVPHGAEVLEVGCGGGQLACRMAERRGDLRWTGLDLSAEQIARARKRGAGKAELRFVEGNALDLAFPSGSFDAVVSVASIKHWPDQAGGLAECVRVLRPGGRLFVAEADRSCKYDDTVRFVELWRIPALARPFAVALFMTHVAGRSLDVDEARDLMAELPLSSWEVRRFDGLPVLAMIGQRGA